MRTKSTLTNGYIVYAVSGTNTISFAIDFRQADTSGLLGFSFERIDHKRGERKFADGFKVFKKYVKKPDEFTIVNTYTQPVQSFVWDDFTCYDDTEYEYLIYPRKGNYEQMDTEEPIKVVIKTEAAFSTKEHDIFFNRGVASSQAYARKFYNLSPDKITNPAMKKEALDWLSRQLDEAIFKFIEQAKPGDTLLGCFYEFHYAPVLLAFKDALKRGVSVKLVVDAKVNETTDSKGFHESFPRVVNLKTLTDVGLSLKPSDGIVIKRESNPDAIQHNKFIVLLDGTQQNKPTQVWTGSTNISNGGIHGQTNVGHWVRNEAVALSYQKYWEVLSKDPGKAKGDDTATGKAKNAAYKEAIESLQPNIKFVDWKSIPKGITPVFSPRSGPTMLKTYADMFDNATNFSCVTLAFGINKVFKDNLADNTNANHISFLLLEKEDKKNPNSKTPFVYVGAKQNVYKSWGAYLEDNLYQWTKEISTRNLGLNTHVAYIHSKFLLVDPLSNDPKVVTGSANFSDASTNDNDENMLIIRGNKRVADIYFTEFNRLFNHYYFRAVYKNAKENNRTDDTSIFLDTTDGWLKKYAVEGYKFKRVEMFTKMEGF